MTAFTFFGEEIEQLLETLLVLQVPRVVIAHCIHPDQPAGVGVPPDILVAGALLGHGVRAGGGPGALPSHLGDGGGLARARGAHDQHTLAP